GPPDPSRGVLGLRPGQGRKSGATVGGLIAFESVGDGNAESYVMNGDGFESGRRPPSYRTGWLGAWRALCSRTGSRRPPTTRGFRPCSVSIFPPASSYTSGSSRAHSWRWRDAATTTSAGFRPST